MRYAKNLILVAALCTITAIFLMPGSLVLTPVARGFPAINPSRIVSSQNPANISVSGGSGISSQDLFAREITLVDRNHDKISDVLAEKMAASAPGEYLPVVISFAGNPSPGELSAIQALGAKDVQVYGVVPACSATIPKEAIPRVAQESFINFIEGFTNFSLCLKDSTQEIQARPFVWDRGYQGDPNDAVAIIDTGIDGSLPDFAGKITYWHDFTTEGYATPVDFVEHGTHCASIAAGSGQNSIGSYFMETHGDYTGDMYTWPYFIKTYGTGNVSISITWDNTMTGVTPYLQLELQNNTVALTSPSFSVSPFTWTSPNLSPGSYNLNVNNYQNAASRNWVTEVKIPAGAPTDSYPANLAGVAPDSKIVALKIFTSDGMTTESIILNALNWIHNNYRAYNVTVVSMSLGSPYIDPVFDAAVNNLVLNDGVVVVCAAGNNGPGWHVGSPASASACIAVGAVNKAGQITDYSSTGDWVDNPSGKPDVMAPGGSASSTSLAPENEILAVASSDSASAGVDPNTGQELSQPNPYPGGYQQMVGTSMACPHVAGLVQLIVQAWPGGWTWNPADALKVKQIICMSAVEAQSSEQGGGIPTDDPGAKDCVQGWGMVFADAAINLTRDNLQLFTPYTVPFGAGMMGLKNFAGKVFLQFNHAYNFTLSVPASCGADLFLWTPSPTGSGDPILVASGISFAMGQSDCFIYTANTTGYYYLTAVLVTGVPVSPASLSINELPTIFVLSPLGGSIFSETASIPLNIDILAPIGFLSAWYSVDGTVNATFSGNATTTLPRGFHNITYYAIDALGDVGSVTVTIGVNSAHPGQHAALVITDPLNGAILSNPDIELQWNFSTDVGTLAACWIVVDNGTAMNFNQNMTLAMTAGSHVVVAYANNTLGEMVQSQVVHFTVTPGPDLMLVILFLLAGVAGAMILIAFHSRRVAKAFIPGGLISRSLAFSPPPDWANRTPVSASRPAAQLPSTTEKPALESNVHAFDTTPSPRRIPVKPAGTPASPTPGTGMQRIALTPSKPVVPPGAAASQVGTTGTTPSPRGIPVKPAGESPAPPPSKGSIERITLTPSKPTMAPPAPKVAPLPKVVPLPKISPPAPSPAGSGLSPREELFNEIVRVKQSIAKIDAAMPNHPNPMALRQQKNILREHLRKIQEEYDASSE